MLRNCFGVNFAWNCEGKNELNFLGFGGEDGGCDGKNTKNLLRWRNFGRDLDSLPYWKGLGRCLFHAVDVVNKAVNFALACASKHGY